MNRRIRRIVPLCLIVACISVGSVHAAMSSPGQFGVSESGVATYAVPVQVPLGTAGIAPQLSLNYSSQAGNGLLGVGWALSGLSVIGRCPQTKAQDGVQGRINFDNNDRYCLDGQRLIAVSGAYGANGTEYRTEREGFSKIVSYGAAGNGPASFKVWTKSGQIMEYGNTGDSRIEAQGKTSVQAWALNKLLDTKGNYLTVAYTKDGANGDFYPQRIDYAGNAKTGTAPNNSVRFQYAARPDVTPVYLAGSLIKNLVRLTHVQTYSGSALVKDYTLQYGTSPQTARSVLTSIVECEGPSGTCMPLTSFGWAYQSQGFSNQRWETKAGAFGDTQRWFVADINGDGFSDSVNVFDDGGLASVDVHVNTGTGFQTQRWETKAGAFGDVQKWFVDDANGDGRSDLINVFDDGGSASADVHVNTGTGFQAQRWQTKAGAFGNAQKWFVADISGDGRPDLINVFDDGDSASVDVHVNTGTGFQAQRWETKAGAFGGAQRWFVADVNGDGRSDLINVFYDGGSASVDVHVNTGTGFLMQRWETKAGSFSDEQKWFVADVNSDGQSDLVNVFYDGGSTSVDVHVNTGTGFLMQRWETKAGILGDTQRWFVADINGDGRSDLINVFDDGGSASVDVHVNTGTGFLMQRWETKAGGFSDTQQWFLADFKGEGGVHPVNIFNDGGLMSVDSHNVEAPADRIVTFMTGLGAKHTVAYLPITKASVYTKDAGGAYPLLNLQFPMYVVSSAISSNGVGGTLTTNYTYGGLKTEVAGRGILGFRWVQTTQAETGLAVRTDYRQDWPYTGLPMSVVKRLSGAGNGGVLSNSNHFYSCLDPATGTAYCAGKRYFVFEHLSEETSWDLNGAALPTITTASQYDIWGNATKITASSSDGYSKTSTNTYTNDTVNWFLGRLTGSTVTSTAP